MAKQCNLGQRRRRSIRLQEYDYGSPGAYFVTICAYERECILDDPLITGIIADVWHALPERFPIITLDEFVVMPNHVHFIVWLQDDAGANGAGASPFAMLRGPESPAPTVGATLAVAPLAVAPDTNVPHQEKDWAIPQPQQVNRNPRLGDVVRAFKSLVFKVHSDWSRVHAPERRTRLWQRNYYEHIIRNERELQAIRRYIRDNPAQWELDRNNPINFKRSSGTPAQAGEDQVAMGGS